MVIRWIKILTCVVSIVASPVMAATVEYEVLQTGTLANGNTTWQYDYWVNHDDPYPNDDPIINFAVLFPLNSGYESIISASPVGWDPLIGVLDPGLPDGGYVDYFSQDVSLDILSGTSVGGFSAIFEWSLASTPGSQPWQVFDALSFLDPLAVLESGNTILRGGTTPPLSAVPLPAAAWLFITGLAGLGVFRKVNPTKSA